MASNWLTNFDTFLYAKHIDDVQLWRLKKTDSSSLASSSSAIMRLTADDFEYVSEVKDHLKLIGYMFSWNIMDYKNFISYISRRRLLVNGEGKVIIELEDVYFRSPGVLSLNTYIPRFDNRAKVIDAVVVPPIVDLQDKCVLGKRVAELEVENKKLDANVTKLKAELATRTNEVMELEVESNKLEADMTNLKAELASRTNEVVELEVESRILEADMTNLKAELASRTNEVVELEVENKKLETDAELATNTNNIFDLESENKILVTDMAKLEADLDMMTNDIASLETENQAMETNMAKLKADLESENMILVIEMRKLKADLDTRTNEIAKLETENQTMETNMAKLKANLANLESEHKILAARTNEVWMKDFSAMNWVGIESLNKLASVDTSFTVVQKKGYYANHDSSVIFVENITNVSSRYWIQIMIGMNAYTAIEIEDLVPNKEKARFLVNKWSSFRSKGKTYAYHR